MKTGGTVPNGSELKVNEVRREVTGTLLQLLFSFTPAKQLSPAQPSNIN